MKLGYPLALTLSLVTGSALLGHVAIAATDIKTQEKIAQLDQSPLTSALVKETDLPLLTPLREQTIAARQLANLVDRTHYLDKPIDADVSAKILDMYLDSLDPDHSIFLASEVAAYRTRYAKDFGIRLKQNDLSAAFDIYNDYLHHVYGYVHYMLERVDKPIALKTTTMLNVDREKAAYFASTTLRQQYWDDVLRSQLISMTISDEQERSKNALLPNNGDLIEGVKALEELTPVDTLKKRYNRQLQKLVRIKSDQVVEQVLNALLATYDPHSNYAAPIEAMEMNRQTSLQLEGVGVSIRPVKGNEDYIRIESIVEGGPSAKSGLVREGDLILGVQQDGEKMVDVIGWPIGEVVGLIRGPRGTKVTVRLVATGTSLSQARNVTLVRDIIQDKEAGVQNRVIEMQRDGKTYRIGVLDIPSFYLNHRARRSGDDYRSVSADTLAGIQALTAQKIDGMVVDLRGNPGGSLDEVVKMVGMFIPQGPAVQIRDQNGNVEVLSDPDNGQIAYTGPLTVMINLASASASEIFSAAMQDYQRGVIIGSTTLGKGTAQVQLENLAFGQATLTQKKFYRVTGGSTQNRGVEPDIAMVNIYGDSFGERKLKNPLQWDTIATAAFVPFTDLRSIMPALVEKSVQRQSKDLQLQYLQQLTQERFVDDEKKPVALDVDIRRQKAEASQAKMLEIENQRRIATGMPVYKDWASLELSKEQESDARAKLKEHQRPQLPEDEAFVTEAGQVLIDMITLPTAK